MRIYSMGSDKVSIIVPVYNPPIAFFKSCIESLIHQTYKDIEMICVDDGSTNGVSEVMDDYGAKDERIHVFHTKNFGVSHARNVGLDHATGTYIMFVDGDDWIDHDCVEKVMAYKKNDAVFWTYMKHYDHHEEVYRQNIEGDINIFDLTFLGSTVKVLYPKKIIGTHRFNEELTNGEDVEFNFRVFQNVNTFHYLPIPFYHYRILKSSAVRKNDESTILKYVKTLEAMEGSCHTKQHEEAYVSFMAISFLMLCINVYLKNGGGIKEIKSLAKRPPFTMLASHLSMVRLPLTRKLPIICLKFHFYLGTYLICKLKIKMDES